MGVRLDGITLRHVFSGGILGVFVLAKAAPTFFDDLFLRILWSGSSLQRDGNHIAYSRIYSWLDRRQGWGSVHSRRTYDAVSAGVDFDCGICPGRPDLSWAAF